MVSQGLGVATGLQDSFNWSAVGMAAIGGGVGTGLVSTGVFADLGIAGGDFGSAVARGALTSVVDQGIGVATGLQSHFDWTGVAAAGIGAGVGFSVGKAIQYSPSAAISDMHNNLLGGVVGAASLVANAATRSLVSGTDFGDNIMAALPDTIGQTIGNIAAGAISGESDGQKFDRLINKLSAEYEASSPGMAAAPISNQTTASNIVASDSGSVAAGSGWTSEGTTGATIHDIPVQVGQLPRYRAIISTVSLTIPVGTVPRSGNIAFRIPSKAL